MSSPQNNRPNILAILAAVALVAVFAAMLFPVFAQSKSAAKRTEALSQAKRMRWAATAASAPSEEANVAGAHDTAAVIRPAAFTPQRQVIRKASLTVRVPNVEEAERNVNRLVSRIRGYVDSASSTDLASQRPVLTMTLRIPVETFDRTIAEFEALGTRLNKTVESEDVTGQIVDLDARLKTKLAQEEVYINLLKQARSLDASIRLQNELTTVRSEIESMTSQRKTLAALSALSTVTLTLEQEAVPSALPADKNWLGTTWAEATTSVGGAFRTVVTTLLWLLVFSPLWIPVLLVLRYSVRASMPKQTEPPSIHPSA